MQTIALDSAPCFEGGTMRTRFAVSAAAVAAMTLGLAAATAVAGPVASADQVYHSAHIALHPVGDEPLRSGFVENIHANGPVIFAHEIYVLNGAEPATSYQVTLNIFVRDPACASPAGLVLPTAAFTTNAAGNGSGDAVFRPSEVPASLRHATHGIIWTVSDSSGIQYSSGCEAVTLD
jgi:hypothetical protein